MKRIILAAIAAIGLGMTIANASAYAATSAPPQQGDQSNYMRGGGQ